MARGQRDKGAAARDRARHERRGEHRATAEPRARLLAVLAPDVVDALDELIVEMVRAELDARAQVLNGRKWLTVAEAGERLGCSADAVRMRVARGHLEHRRQGRRLYVAAASIDDLR